MRERDATATKHQLLHAARRRFRFGAFNDVSLRDIAADAGVDASLISRYFGSKADIFREVVASVAPGTEIFEGERGDFGKRMAAAIFDDRQGDAFSDGVLIVMRAVGSEEALDIVRAAAATWTLLLEHWIGTPDQSERAFIIRSILMGICYERALRSPHDATGLDLADLEARLAALFQAQATVA